MVLLVLSAGVAAAVAKPGDLGRGDHHSIVLRPTETTAAPLATSPLTTPTTTAVAVLTQTPVSGSGLTTEGAAAPDGHALASTGTDAALGPIGLFLLGLGLAGRSLLRPRRDGHPSP